MKKILGSLLLAGTAVIALSACTPTQSQPGMTPGPAMTPQAMQPGGAMTPDAMKPGGAMTPDAMKPGGAMTPDAMKPGGAMTPDAMKPAENARSAYITFDELRANPGKYAGTRQMMFFHATWCHICEGVDKELKADMGKVPAGTTVVKVDYDKNTELRQKYGVTSQHTVVQVDKDGRAVKKWNVTRAADIASGVQA